MRMRRFLRFKTFEGRHNLVVTEEMKALVAASAVQLTFGLKDFVLAHFNTIVLFPEEFYNRRTENYHMGETHSRGMIVLSWADLKHGFDKSDDAINVGLHEMSHALELEWLLKKNYDELFGNYFAKWSQVIKDTFENLQNERSSFLRQYAGTNRREFFAVCVEYFFESPEEFRQQLPEVYRHLSLLLNQDPLSGNAPQDERPIRTRKELLPELEGATPIFRTRVSAGSFLFYLRAMAIVYFLLFGWAMGGEFGRYFIAVPIALIPVGGMLFVNRIVLYERFLVVKSSWGRVRNIYELDSIAAIELATGNTGEYLSVIRIHNGISLVDRHYYFGRSDDQHQLLELLRSKQVPLKT